jgi:hypothetical protein
MRDRARDERGIVLRVRLLTDLAVDLGATVVRGWQPAATPLVTRVDAPGSARGPRFDIIEVPGPRPQAIAAGMLTSVLLFASFAFLFQAKEPPIVPGYFGEASQPDIAGPVPNDSPPEAAATGPEAYHPLIVAIATTLQRRYVDPVIGQQLASVLLTRDRNGEYESLDLGANLAARINSDIHTASLALGIPPGVFVADVVYSAQPLPTGPPPMTEDMQQRNRAALLEQNCLFETIETLPHNVGYVKLNGFADPAVCRETARRAMTSLNTAGALIIDLRDNGGGIGDTALQIAGYLFDHPTYMFDPRSDSTVPGRTASPIVGNRLADKPVYVLTSARTQSAAEYFVYNLKMWKRATIVGETTAGRQHSGAFHRLSDHFGIGVQEVPLPENPHLVKGWEVIGVEPDVRVSAADAFDAATTLAERRQ